MLKAKLRFLPSRKRHMVELSQYESLNTPRHAISELSLCNSRHDDLPFFVDDSASIRNISHGDPETHPVSYFELLSQKVISSSLDDLLDD